jgi:hypothetical protein
VPEELTVVVDLPGEGLEWSAATQEVPGSRIESKVETVQLLGGRYTVTTLVAAHGFPPSALTRTVEHLKARYGGAAVEVVQKPGPSGAVLRTRLDVEALQSPYVRFLLRFFDQFKAVSAHIEAGRLEVRGTPRIAAAADEDAARIRAFLRKLGTPASVRVERCDAPTPSR